MWKQFVDQPYVVVQISVRNQTHVVRELLATHVTLFLVKEHRAHLVLAELLVLVAEVLVSSVDRPVKKVLLIKCRFERIVGIPKLFSFFSAGWVYFEIVFFPDGSCPLDRCVAVSNFAIDVLGLHVLVHFFLLEARDEVFNVQAFILAVVQVPPSDDVEVTQSMISILFCFKVFKLECLDLTLCLSRLVACLRYQLCAVVVV